MSYVGRSYMEVDSLSVTRILTKHTLLNWPVLSVRSQRNALALQVEFALGLHHSVVLILRIVNYLPKYFVRILFDRNVLKFLDFFLDWLHIHYLFVVLGDFLHRVVLLLHHLSWNIFNDFLLMVVYYFFSFWH